MAPRTRRSTRHKKSDQALQDEEIHEHQINEQTTQEQQGTEMQSNFIVFSGLSPMKFV